MRIKSYTIGALRDLEILPVLDRVQFTLNSRMSPSLRQTRRALSLYPSTYQTDIFVHYDYIHTVPRYPLVYPSRREEIVKEIISIMEESRTNKRIKGIILHTDAAFSVEFLDAVFTKMMAIPAAVDKHLNSRMYPTDEVKKLVASVIQADTTRPEFLQLWNSLAMSVLYKDLKSYGAPTDGCKVYIENSAHLRGAGDVQSTVVAGSIPSNVLATSGMYDIFGICWDTEHAFASGDALIEEEQLLMLKQAGVPLMVHLNTIEKGVKRGNFVDRHSLTTVFECTHYPVEYYTSLVEMLDRLEIPYIREVKAETMKRELQEQLKQDNAI